jgi:hypothetical protein
MEFMRSRILLAVIAIAFAATGALTGRVGAVGAPNVRVAGAETGKHALLLPVHGCHRNYDTGWVREWGARIEHKHGGDCRPKAGGKGEYFEERQRDDDQGGRSYQRGYDRGDEGYSERGFSRRGRDYEPDYGEGPPPGWGSYQRRPYDWQERGCQQFGPLWYCP